MKKLYRRIIAFVAIIILLTINWGPFALLAFAKSDTVAWSQPVWKDPAWKQPVWESPSTWNSAPEWQSPNWQSPEWNQSPEWQNPNWQSPEWNQSPEWQNPGWETSPDGKVPSQNSGDNGSNNNDSSSGKEHANDGNTNNNNGQNTHDKNNPIGDSSNKGSNSNQDSNSNTGSNSNQDSNSNTGNESKIDPWTLGKYAIKDVGVNTAKYVNNLIKLEQTNGSISTSDFLKENGKLKWKLGSATYKLATKGTFFEDVNKEYDKYKGIYDNGKLGVDTSRKAYDLISYFKNTRNVNLQGGYIDPRVHFKLGPISKFNAGVAAVGVVTSGIDMGININKAIHAKPGEERQNAIADSVGSLGDMLMSGGTVATASGAAAAVGVGLIVVGGTLKLGSVIYKNRKKIMEFISNPKEAIIKAVKTTVEKVKTFGSKLKKIFSWG
ncbi:hypothetical protein ACQKP0_21785 [Heyndrickxia sp. NPDC080065]|uniref:hypothetical protein n=1 Tax=Heyndrickxia sp. NPDC080065 TaxID=3390568 RepID=UPI003D0369BD